MTEAEIVERLVEPIARAIAERNRPADVTPASWWAIRASDFVADARAVLQSDALSGLIKPLESDDATVTKLLDMHERMMRAEKDQRPYPVKMELGKADSGTLISAAVALEHAKSTIERLSAELERVKGALGEVRQMAVDEHWEPPVFCCRIIECIDAALTLPPTNNERSKSV